MGTKRHKPEEIVTMASGEESGSPDAIAFLGVAPVVAKKW